MSYDNYNWGLLKAVGISLIVVAVVAFALVFGIKAAASASGVPYGPNECWGCATPWEKFVNRNIIVKRFGASAPRALHYVYRESGFNARAANRHDWYGGSYGLFQINYSHHSWVNFARIKDPAYNVQVAWRLSRHGTCWSAWGGPCYAR